jgi:hypothetical protein
MASNHGIDDIIAELDKYIIGDRAVPHTPPILGSVLGAGVSSQQANSEQESLPDMVQRYARRYGMTHLRGKLGDKICAQIRGLGAVYNRQKEAIEFRLVFTPDSFGFGMYFEWDVGVNTIIENSADMLDEPIMARILTAYG